MFSIFELDEERNKQVYGIKSCVTRTHTGFEPWTDIERDLFCTNHTNEKYDEILKVKILSEEVWRTCFLYSCNANIISNNISVDAIDINLHNFGGTYTLFEFIIYHIHIYYVYYLN
jgi:hypothetical protein